MKYLLLPLGLLALGSCNDQMADRNTTTTEEPTLAPAEREPGVVTSPTQTLDATNAAIKSAGGDITALPVSAAASNIDTWMSQLGDVDGADKVTANLKELKKALMASDVNGQLAGMLLITLAEDTRQVAGSGMSIGMLTSALKAGGEKLTSATITGNSLLSQTLMAVKGVMGDITTLPATAAVGNVDGWIEKLQGMDGTSEIVRDLNTLKTELQAPTIDGSKVSKLMFDMAEDTRAMGGGDKGVETLAYALEAGGWRLK